VENLPPNEKRTDQHREAIPDIPEARHHRMLVTNIMSIRADNNGASERNFDLRIALKKSCTLFSPPAMYCSS
jgi:hypothetical protein